MHVCLLLGIEAGYFIVFWNELNIFGNCKRIVGVKTIYSFVLIIIYLFLTCCAYLLF